MTEPHAFEERTEILNPKHGMKRVLFDGANCYTLGPEDDRASGIQFAHQDVPCPKGIATLLASCRGRLLLQQGDGCVCETIEGNPPPPAKPVACPPP